MLTGDIHPVIFAMAIPFELVRETRKVPSCSLMPRSWRVDVYKTGVPAMLAGRAPPSPAIDALALHSDKPVLAPSVKEPLTAATDAPGG